MKNIISKGELDRINMLCKQYNIQNYTIDVDSNREAVVNVNGSVFMEGLNLATIPIKFGKVSGDFTCSTNVITTLHNAPRSVGLDFDVSSNHLTNLFGGPISVGGSIWLSGNSLTSLEGAPEYIGIDIRCGVNRQLNNTFSGYTDIDLIGKIHALAAALPNFIYINRHHMPIILRYQRHFEIWNDDLSLNVLKFQELLDEINDGLE